MAYSRKPPSTTVGCVYAKRTRKDSGYGIISVNGNNRMAHRVMWEKTYGPIPDGMKILHKCDNPPCVNLEHLFIGTQQDNVADRKAKGRDGDHKGENNGRSKITVQTAVRIKMMKGVLPQYRIAEILGLTQAMVGRIMNGVAWKHVTADTRFAF